MKDQINNKYNLEIEEIIKNEDSPMVMCIFLLIILINI